MPGDRYYIDIAKAVRLWSKDRSRKIGSVIVGEDGEIRSTGYNGMPKGVDDDVESRHDRPAKYLFTEHSERNAVYQAARAGVSTKGCTLYTWAEGNDIGICADCARAIIQSGIVEVVLQKNEGLNSIWSDSILAGMEMLGESKVKVRYFDE